VSVADDRRRRFDLLYREHREQVLAFLLRRTAQPADATDVLHDVFVVAWRRIDEVPDGDAARMWLFGVAHRTLANHRRSGHRRTRLVSALTDAVTAVLRTAPQQEHPTLHEALGTLSADDRVVLTLSAWEGLNPTEIGTVLGIDPSTARGRLYRARQRLRDRLEAPRPATSGRPGGGPQLAGPAARSRQDKTTREAG
jgi:RNA polymerase sigma-70 factor (ECF subfamily)